MTKILLLMLLVMCGACDRPPCSPEDEDVTEWGPVTDPEPWGPDDGDHRAGPGDSDGDAYGYMRDKNGGVCACDLREHEEGGCQDEPPPACDPQVGWNVLTGECAEPMQYFGGKKQLPPPGPPPPSGGWQCSGAAECHCNEETWFTVFENGRGDDEEHAKLVTQQRLTYLCMGTCWKMGHQGNALKALKFECDRDGGK